MTSVFRLKAASPHFAAVDEASHPIIIMRRSSTSERTVTPASGQTSLSKLSITEDTHQTAPLSENAPRLPLSTSTRHSRWSGSARP